MQVPQSTIDDQGQLPPFDPQEPVRITDRLDPNHDRRILNQYIRGERIGGGPNGPEVFACRDGSGSGYPLVKDSFLLLGRLLTRVVHYT